MLMRIRNALEAGNWKEAWSWLAEAGIPGLKIPEKISEEVWKTE
jgi:hypothetical protein